MKYIILLRGVNISGKNIISMKELKEELDKYFYSNVITYLNSGNIILDSNMDKSDISDIVKDIIKKKFYLDIPVYVMTSLELEDILEHSPKWWGCDNKKIYNNIIFIMPPVTYQELYDVIGEPSNDIDKVLAYHDVVFWSFDLNNYRKSNWWRKTASIDIKDYITIRTANTMRKILELCYK